MIYAAQLRAGRALLGWRQEDLATKAQVGLATVQRIEKSEGLAAGNAGTIWKLQSALETAGVSFIQDATTIGVSTKRSGSPRVQKLERLRRSPGPSRA
jgi:transcriptional regulator with XRE-family HTH domain